MWALALEAADRLVSVQRVISYEPPFVLDPAGNVQPDRFRDELDAMIAEGRHGDAMRAFMRLVGAPRPMVAVIQSVWAVMPLLARRRPGSGRSSG